MVYSHHSFMIVPLVLSFCHSPHFPSFALAKAIVMMFALNAGPIKLDFSTGALHSQQKSNRWADFFYRSSADNLSKRLLYNKVVVLFTCIRHKTEWAKYVTAHSWNSVCIPVCVEFLNSINIYIHTCRLCLDVREWKTHLIFCVTEDRNNHHSWLEKAVQSSCRQIAWKNDTENGFSIHPDNGYHHGTRV